MKKIFSFFAALLFAGSMMADTFNLVTDASTLAAGDEIIIVNTGCTKAISTTQNSNNRASASVTESADAITPGETVQIIVLEASDANWKLKVGTDAYLYAASSSSNHLKTSTATTAGNNGVWAITIGDNGVASIVAQGSNSRKVMQYNGAGSSDLFACYASASQTALKIFKKSTGEAPAVAKPAIAGETSFVESTEVTITCDTLGASIHYTLDGSDPAAPEALVYADPFTINATTTVKAIAIKGSDTSAVAEKTFTKIVLLTCAEASALAKDQIAHLGEVTVAYVNSPNIYVKDESGYALIFAYDFGLVAGDVVTGFVGKSSPYNGLPELKPEGVALADLTVVHGEAPAPELLTAAPTAADVNKYVLIKGVSCDEEFDSNKNMTVTLGEEEFVLRNNFNIANVSFDTEKTYDIVGACAIYTKNDQTTIQLYYISSEEHIEPADRRINAWGLNSVANGDDYTFSFYSNIAGNEASLLFYNNGSFVGRVKLDDAPVAGLNEVTLNKADIPAGTGLTWAVELKANRVEAFGLIYADAALSYGRAYANVDIHPESDHFGQIYLANRLGTKTNSRLYLYNPLSFVRSDGYLMGEDQWGFGRFDIAENGKLYLPDYSDNHSGCFIVDPSDLTSSTQFFAGTRNGDGLFTNGTVETGSSLAAVRFFGKGANTKMFTVAEDYTGKSFPVAIFNVGNEDGSIKESWTTAPDYLFNTLGNAAQNFDIRGCEYGAWVATSRSAGQNNSGATSLRFYDFTGECKYTSSDHTDIINGSMGGGFTITEDGKTIYMVNGNGNIMELALTWNEGTPSLSLVATYETTYNAISSINCDFAGNLVVTAGSGFTTSATSQLGLSVYGMPTNNNKIVVPAKKALTVIGTDPNPTTAIDNSFVPVKVEKIFRNGEVLIIKDGKTYNMMGQIVR